MLQDFKNKWADTPEAHAAMRAEFQAAFDATPYLVEHRRWVEKHSAGHGEHPFHWMWKNIVDEMPATFSFMEIGVYKGQILSLVELLANATAKTVTRYGVTPLNGTDGHVESDYASDIKAIHEAFGLAQWYKLFVGLSNSQAIISEVKSKVKDLDILYIDGGHSYNVVKSDLENYLPLVRKGGILVVDDCCNSFKMYEGAWNGGGLPEVTRAVDEVLPPFKKNDEWEFLFSVVHNRVYRKIKSK